MCSIYEALNIHPFKSAPILRLWSLCVCEIRTCTSNFGSIRNLIKKWVAMQISLLLPFSKPKSGELRAWANPGIRSSTEGVDIDFKWISVLFQRGFDHKSPQGHISGEALYAYSLQIVSYLAIVCFWIDQERGLEDAGSRLCTFLGNLLAGYDLFPHADHSCTIRTLTVPPETGLIGVVVGSIWKPPPAK